MVVLAAAAATPASGRDTGVRRGVVGGIAADGGRGQQLLPTLSRACAERWWARVAGACAHPARPVLHSLLPLPPVVGRKLYTSPGRGSAYLHTPGVMHDLG